MAESGDAHKDQVVVKVGVVGDSQIGKTSLMVKYVEGNFDEDYIQTLGVNFMEKSVSVRGTMITFSIWDLGGHKETSTLNSVKDWFRQARGFNKEARAILVGTKYDVYASSLTKEEQENVTKQARRYAKAMKAPLIYCSSKHSINIQKIFKIVLSKVFDLNCSIPMVLEATEPIIEY